MLSVSFWRSVVTKRSVLVSAPLADFILLVSMEIHRQASQFRRRRFDADSVQVRNALSTFPLLGREKMYAALRPKSLPTPSLAVFRQGGTSSRGP